MGSKINRWADHYTRQAKREHFPARSVYKLKEIQRRFGLIKPGDRVLDLGCSPGSWLLYAAELTGPGGQITGIDIQPVGVPVPKHVRVLAGDVLSADAPLFETLGIDFDVILSDMAPSTTGIKSADSARSYELCLAALRIAERHLRKGGTLLCKIFQGEEFKRFQLQIQNLFQNHKIFKPQSSRKASREIYIIGTGKRN